MYSTFIWPIFVYHLADLSFCLSFTLFPLFRIGLFLKCNTDLRYRGYFLSLAHNISKSVSKANHPLLAHCVYARVFGRQKPYFGILLGFEQNLGPKFDRFLINQQMLSCCTLIGAAAINKLTTTTSFLITRPWPFGRERWEGTWCVGSKNVIKTTPINR